MAFGRTPVDSKYQEELAENLYKYQNFKSSVINSKVTSPVYQGSSIIAFHSLLRRYLATGEKDLIRASEAFYNTIDRVKSQCLVALRPSADEEARPYTKHSSKIKKTKVIKTVDTSVRPVSTEKKLNISAETLNNIKLHQRSTFVALKVEDSLKTFKNEDEMNGYIKAYKDIDSDVTFEKVRITIETL